MRGAAHPCSIKKTCARRYSSVLYVARSILAGRTHRIGRPSLSSPPHHMWPGASERATSARVMLDASYSRRSRSASASFSACAPTSVNGGGTHLHEQAHFFSVQSEDPQQAACCPRKKNEETDGACTEYWKVRCFPSLKRPITWFGGRMSERRHDLALSPPFGSPLGRLQGAESARDCNLPGQTASRFTSQRWPKAVGVGTEHTAG